MLNLMVIYLIEFPQQPCGEDTVILFPFTNEKI